MDESSPSPSSSSTKASSCTTSLAGLNICCICKASGKLVKHPRPESYQLFIQSVNTRSLYGDNKYISIQEELGDVTANELSQKGVTWHLECYKIAVHKIHIERLKNRYEAALEAGEVPKPTKVGRPERTNLKTQPPPHENPSSTERYMRSGAKQYNKNNCFFCNGSSEKGALHQISEFNTGEQLRKAVEYSNNQQWKVNLSAAIDPNDAHAIDIKYHLYCWVKHVQRTQVQQERADDEAVITKVSADIEFFYLMSSLLKSGSILDMGEVEAAYQNVLRVNGSNDTHISRRSLKRKLVENIDDVEFCRSTHMNEPDRMYTSRTKRAAIDNLDEAAGDASSNMKAVFESAKVIRRDIAEALKQPWKFQGSLLDENQVPKSLEAFIRWILIGPMLTLESTQREHSIQLVTRNIAQTIMFAYKSDRQVSYVPKQTHYSSYMP